MIDVGDRVAVRRVAAARKLATVCGRARDGRLVVLIDGTLNTIKVKEEQCEKVQEVAASRSRKR